MTVLHEMAEAARQADPVKVLTPEAEADRIDFHSEYGDGNCYCHLGAAPCGSCTHPGNPINQVEDESCWEVPK